MSSLINQLVRLFKSSSSRNFVLIPLITIAWELLLNKGKLQLVPVFIPVMAWGYLQYRFVGQYRIKRGGGGPGFNTPPERIVTTGAFAYTRNPMYSGHIIFLIGLALTFKSLFGALIAVATAIWFHFRVIKDEYRLSDMFGEPYVVYMKKVKRWIPWIL